jgi:hypothetical protein
MVRNLPLRAGNWFGIDRFRLLEAQAGLKLANIEPDLALDWPLPTETWFTVDRWSPQPQRQWFGIVQSGWRPGPELTTSKANLVHC